MPCFSESYFYTYIFQFTRSDSSFTNCFKYSTALTILLSWKIDVCTIPSSEAEWRIRQFFLTKGPNIFESWHENNLGRSFFRAITAEKKLLLSASWDISDRIVRQIWDQAIKFFFEWFQSFAARRRNSCTKSVGFTIIFW